VNAKVRHVLSDGLLVSFLTYFNGTVDPFHISMVSFRVPHLGNHTQSCSGVCDQG